MIKREDWKILRVGLYKRCSTLEQAVEGTSLETQEEILKKYIEDPENWLVLEEWMIFSDDWVSWAKEHRPWLDRLKREVRMWNIDVVLVMKIDRLFRSTKLLLDFVDFLDEYKVGIISKNEKIDTKDPVWKFFLTLLGAFATMERDFIRERTVLWKIAMSKKWCFVWGPMPPTGYKLDDKKKMLIDEDEAKIIKEIFNLSLEWKTNKRVQNYWHSRTIWNILRNETYNWRYYYWKTTTVYNDVTKKYKTIQVPVEQRVMFECPKIIEDDVFKKVQENIDKNKVIWRWQKRIFTWKIVCWLCGYKYHWYKSSKNTMNYTCHNSYKSRALDEVHICKNTWISENILRDFVIKKIYELIEDPSKFYESYINNDQEFNKVFENYENELKEINKRIKDIEWENSRLFKELWMFNDEKSKSSIRKIINENNSNIGTLETRKNEVEEKISDLKKQKYWIKAINDFIKTYKIKLKSLNKEQEDELIEIFVDRVVVTFNDIVVELNIKWNFNNKNWYEELRLKMEEMDNENKKKLEKVKGGEKLWNNWLKDEHFHFKIKITIQVIFFIFWLHN